MNYEPALRISPEAFEPNIGHLAGSVGPQEAYELEVSMSMRQQPEQQQAQQRHQLQVLGGTAELGARLGGPVAFFIPHGYHAGGSGSRRDRHIL